MGPFCSSDHDLRIIPGRGLRGFFPPPESRVFLAVSHPDSWIAACRDLPLLGGTRRQQASELRQALVCFEADASPTRPPP